MKKSFVKQIMAFAVAVTLLIGSGMTDRVMAYSESNPNNWSNTGKASKDIVQIALTQVGYKETDTDHTKYGEWYYNKDKSVPWCAIFISWCANEAGISTSIISKNALASGYSASNMSRNSFSAPAYAFDDTKAKVGDIAYIDTSGNGVSNHVGLVYAVDDNYIYTIEGNSNSKVAKVRYRADDGHRQNSSYVSKAQIVFYARPKYSDAGTTASDKKTSTNTTSSTTTASTGYQTGNYKTIGKVNIRSKATSSSTKLGELPKGTVVKVTKVTGNWGVFTYNNMTAYVYLPYTEKVEEKAAEEKNTEADYALGTYKMNHDMNIRSSASDTAKKLGMLKSGTKVTVTKTNGKWGAFTYEGKTAWVSLKYATMVAKAAETTASSDSKGSAVKDTYQITADTLTVRAEPSTDAKVLGGVKKGETCEVTEIKNSFGKISYKGKTGWICLKYAKVQSKKTTASGTTTAAAAATSSSSTSYEKGTYQVTAASLTVRAEANTESKALGTVKNGEKYEIKEISGRFGKITYKGSTGWISLKYATLIEKAASTKTTSTSSKTTSTSSKTTSTSSKTASYAKGTYQVTADRLTVRAEANAEAKSLGIVRAGDTCKVTEVKNGFGKISYMGNTGWISLKYCKMQ